MSEEIFAQWKQDPEFVQLPEGEKAKIYLNFFNQNAVDNEFNALPVEEQDRIKGNFLQGQGLQGPPTIVEEPSVPAMTDPDMFTMEAPPRKRGFFEDPLEQIKEGVAHTLAGPARVMVDLAKVPAYLGGMLGGMFTDEGEDSNWLEKAANTSIKDLDKLSDNLTFTDAPFGTDALTSALMTGGVGVGARVMMEKAGPAAAKLARTSLVPKGFESVKLSESLAPTFAKSAVSGTVGDVTIGALMEATDPLIEKTPFTEATKDIIRGTVPILMGIGTAWSIENKIDRLLKNPLAVNIAKTYSKSGNPKAVIDRWYKEGVFDDPAFKDVAPEKEISRELSDGTVDISKGLGKEPGELIDASRIVDTTKVGGRQGEVDNVPSGGEIGAGEGVPLVKKADTGEPLTPDTGDIVDKPPGPTILEHVEPEYIPVNNLNLSDDVPNFKDNADSRGVVDELEGKFEELGTGPIVVWERTSGDLEVITGRHRLDLAKRSGNNEILSQVVREKDGFTADMAMTFDAEANIRDNQGSVKDYANYFRNTKVTNEEASSRGLLRTDKGRSGFVIGKDASDDLYSLFKAGKISKDKATGIASTAPKHEELQQLGINYAQKHSADDTSNYLQAIQTIVPKADSGQAVLFGKNEGWQIEADKMAKAASSMASNLRDEQRALRSASRLGGVKSKEFANKYNIDPGDTEAINKRLDEVGKEIVYMSKWATDPALVDEVRIAAGLDKADDLNIREQQSLFGKPEEKPFDLRPEELTKGEKLARAQEKAKKAGLLPKRKGLTFPAGKGIKPANVGDQLGLFNDQGQIDIKFDQTPQGPLQAKQVVGVADTAGRVKAAGWTVDDMDGVASLLSEFKNHAQENLFIVTTNKTGKILEIHRYSKGDAASGIAKPVESIGHVLNIPGADKAYFVHNHPSGDPRPSSAMADQGVFKQFKSVMDLKGISTQAAVIGKDKWLGYSANSIGSEIPIKALKSTTTIPLKERVFTKRSEGKLANGSDSAREIIKSEYGDKEGFLLLDNKNRDVGFLSFTPGHKSKDTASEIISSVESTGTISIVFNSKKNVGPDSDRARFLRDVAVKLRGMGILTQDILTPQGSHRDIGALKYQSGKAGVGPITMFAGTPVSTKERSALGLGTLGSDTKVYLHPSTITSPIGGMAYGVNWDEAHDEAGFHPEKLKIDPAKALMGAVAGGVAPSALKHGRRVLSSLTHGYTKRADKVLDAFKDITSGMVVNENLRYGLGMNKSKEFKDLFRTYKRDETRIRNSAVDFAKELTKVAPTKLEQKRLFQVLQGSVTANKEFTAKAELVRGKFNTLRKDLEEYNLLNLSRFDKLTKKERAGIRKELAGPDPAGTNFAGKQMTKPDLLTYADKLGVEVSTKASRESVIERIQGHLNTQRQRLHDYYHFGSAREYVPFYYDKFEGLSKKNLMDLQQEIKYYKNLSRGGTPEGKQEIEALVADLENLAKTKKGKRGMGFKDMKLDLGYSHRRQDIPVEVQHMMGKIEEGAYATGKGLATQGSDVRKAKLFKDISDNPEWTMVKVKGERKPPSNFVEVKGKQYGDLNGKYVRNDVWNDLKEVEEWRTEAGRLYDKALGMWKYGKVVLNPATQSRNFVSNMVLAYFGDVSPGDVKTYSKTIKAVTNKKTNKFYKEAEEWGLYNDTFYSAEIGKLRDSLKSVRDPGKLKNWIRNAVSLPATAYQESEKFFKTAVFIKARESGMSIDKAARKAEEHLFNYADIPPWVKFGKRWVSPFLTFSYKAIPLYAKTAIRKPWKVAAIGAAMYGIEEYSKDRFGMSDEEAKKERGQLPPWMRDKVPPVLGPYAHVLMPFKNKWGDNLYLDTSYILPYGNIGELSGQSTIIPQILGPNNPFTFTIPAAIVLNRDPFTGRDLFSKSLHDSIMKSGTGKMVMKQHVKVLGEYLKYAWMQLTPSLMGYSGDKLLTGYKNMFDDKDPVLDWADRPQDMGTAIMSSLFGVKLTPANKKKLKEFTYKSSMRISKEIGMEVGRLKAKSRRNEITPKEMRDQVKALYKLKAVLMKNQ